MDKKDNNIMHYIYIIFVNIGGFTLLCFICYLVYKIINLFWNLANSNVEISTALIAGTIAFLSIPIGRYFEHRYYIKNEVRKERQKVYIEFLDWFIDDYLLSNVEGKSNIQTTNEIKQMQKKLTIYASDKVFNNWLILKKELVESVTIKNKMSKEEKTIYYCNKETLLIEKLILSMRNELGYKNTNIKDYDIMRCYINDIDKYLYKTIKSSKTIK